MTNSEIIQEVQDNVDEIRNIINKQKFTVADAEKYLERYINILRRLEQLEMSRDSWKRHYFTLKDKLNNLKGGKK